jgi:hypothetical protein
MACTLEFESSYLFLSTEPFKIIGCNQDIRGKSTAGKFPASGAMAVLEETGVSLEGIVHFAA